MVGHERDLQIGLPSRPRQGGDEREPLDDGMEEERGETDLGRHPQAGEAAPLEEARADGARGDFENPRQRESCGHPEKRDDTLIGQQLGEQMEGDHSRRRGEGEGAGPLQESRMPPRRQRQAAAEQRGKSSEAGGPQHHQLRQLSQSPRNSRRWPLMR